MDVHFGIIFARFFYWAKRVGFMDRQKKTILLVEAVESHIESVRRAFESHNDRFELKVVSTLREAKAYLGHSGPSLVITDLLLPDGRGTELLPPPDEPPDFPLVMISGQSGEREGLKILKRGALDFMIKSKETFVGMPYAAERALREWDHLKALKKAEEALRLERDNLTSILDTMEDGVYVVDNKNEIRYLNPAIKKEFGPIRGRKCFDYFHDRKDPCRWCKNDEVFAGKTIRWKWVSDKSRKTYDLTNTPLINPDGGIWKLAIMRDVTEQKHTMEALRKANKEILKQQKTVIEEERLKVLHQMAGATAHELNQPLMVLLGNIELMSMNRESSDKMMHYVSKIEEAGKRISQVVRKIQTIHHVETKPYLGDTSIVKLDQKIRILTIEDSDDDFDTLKSSIQGNPQVEVSRTVSIDEAKQVLEKNRFDLIFLDGHLSNGDSLDFLIGMGKEGLNMPVVVLTSQGDEMTAALAIRAGAYEYLSRDDVNQRSVARIIGNTLEKARLKREIEEVRREMTRLLQEK
jgi:DNA-binding response OmpR family regulator